MDIKMPFQVVHGSIGKKISTHIVLSSADAETAQNVSRFFNTPLVSLVEFSIAGYYDPGRLWHAVSQDTGLFCNVQISTFCCIM